MLDMDEAGAGWTGVRRGDGAVSGLRWIWLCLASLVLLSLLPIGQAFSSLLVSTTPPPRGGPLLALRGDEPVSSAAATLRRHAASLGRRGQASGFQGGPASPMVVSLGRSSHPSSGGTESRAEVVLVDDEEPLLTAVRDYLRDCGFSVKAFGSAIEACTYLYEVPSATAPLPDVIVSDVTMPVMDGYHLLRQVKEIPAVRNTPVIFLTARGMTRDRIRGYEAGVNAYLPKPFDPDELVSIVLNLVAKVRQERAKETDMQKEMDKVKEQSAATAVVAKSSAADGAATTAAATSTPPRKKKSSKSRSKARSEQGGEAAAVPSPAPVPAPSAAAAPAPAPRAPVGSTAAAKARAPVTPPPPLTPREAAVLELVCEGMTNREIGVELKASPSGVEKHVSKLFVKTGTTKRTDLVRYAIRHGLATP